MKGDLDGIYNWERKSLMVRGWIDIVEKDDTLRLMERLWGELMIFLSIGSLGWFDRTCSLQQDQWTKNRFRPGCHQSEGGRTGKGVSIVGLVYAVWLLSFKKEKKTVVVDPLKYPDP